MKAIKPSLQLMLHLAKVYTVMTRRFDGNLNGLSLNELIVLLQLSRAPDERMRRVDLAETVGLTASGITRLLLPMEKIGLVKKQVNKDDARSSYVALDRGGKKKLAEALDRAEQFSEEMLERTGVADVESISRFLMTLGGAMR